MYAVEMAKVKVYNGYDVEVGTYETYLTGFSNIFDAELFMEENIYQDAFDTGYDVSKVSHNDFNWLVFGSYPKIFKFINFEDPSDVQYSTFRIVDQEF